MAAADGITGGKIDMAAKCTTGALRKGLKAVAAAPVHKMVR